MTRIAFVFAATAALATAVPAGAAVIVDTGVSQDAVPTFRLVGVQNFVYGQFTVAQGTRITAVSTQLDVTSGGNFRFTLWSAGILDPDQPGVNLYAANAAFASGTGYAARGVTGLDWQVVAGTYWVGLAADGASTTALARIRGGAPSPLGNEVTYTVATGNISDDTADLSWRIEGDALAAVQPSVPEPATWALMLAGFGAVGAALRRRRMSVAFG